MRYRPLKEILYTVSCGLLFRKVIKTDRKGKRKAKPDPSPASTSPPPSESTSTEQKCPPVSSNQEALSNLGIKILEMEMRHVTPLIDSVPGLPLPQPPSPEALPTHETKDSPGVNAPFMHQQDSATCFTSEEDGTAPSHESTRDNHTAATKPAVPTKETQEAQITTQKPDPKNSKKYSKHPPPHYVPQKPLPNSTPAHPSHLPPLTIPPRLPTPEIASRTRYRGLKSIAGASPNPPSPSSPSSPSSLSSLSPLPLSPPSPRLFRTPSSASTSRNRRDRYSWNSPLAHLIPDGFKIMHSESRNHLRVVPRRPMSPLNEAGTMLGDAECGDGGVLGTVKEGERGGE